MIWECYTTGRKQLVAALLRFADELDIDSSRVSSIKNIMTFAMEPGNAVYWWLHNFTTIAVDRGVVTITVTVHPRDKDEFGTIIYDKVIAEFQRKNKTIIAVLGDKKFRIAISSFSAVNPSEYEKPLPPELRQALLQQSLSKPASASPPLPVPPPSDPSPPPPSPASLPSDPSPNQHPVAYAMREISRIHRWLTQDHLLELGHDQSVLDQLATNIRDIQLYLQQQLDVAFLKHSDFSIVILYSACLDVLANLLEEIARIAEENHGSVQNTELVADGCAKCRHALQKFAEQIGVRVD